MNTSIKYLLILCAFFLSGIVFFAYQESWIIINIPQAHVWQNLQKPKTIQIDGKLWAFKNNGWIHETKQIIKTNDAAKTIQNLLSSWFVFLEEEHILNRIINVQSCILSATNKTAFVSLSHNPFTDDATTYDCLMLIEGILKTLRENKAEIQNIQILIQHNPWVDHRLNMEIPWPITGYITT